MKSRAGRAVEPQLATAPAVTTIGRDEERRTGTAHETVQRQAFANIASRHMRRSLLRAAACFAVLALFAGGAQAAAAATTKKPKPTITVTKVLQSMFARRR